MRTAIKIAIVIALIITTAISTYTVVSMQPQNGTLAKNTYSLLLDPIIARTDYTIGYQNVIITSSTQPITYTIITTAEAPNNYVKVSNPLITIGGTYTIVRKIESSTGTITHDTITITPTEDWIQYVKPGAVNPDNNAAQIPVIVIPQSALNWEETFYIAPNL